MATDQNQVNEDWESISAGIADLEAGRYQSFAEVDAELRAKHDIPRSPKLPGCEPDNDD